MAGGNYHNQLYNDYATLTEKYEALITELKKQTAQHKADWIEMQRLTKQIEQKDKMNDQLIKKNDELVKQVTTLAKEVARLNQINGMDSTNSGFPTSHTQIQKKKHVPNSRTKSKKKKGGQPGHKKHTLKKFDEQDINAYEEHKVSECPHCQGTVEKIDDGKTKDEFDYKVVLVKKRHHFPVYQCTNCHRKAHTPIPVRLKEENQYGPHVQAMALTFINEGNVSINKTQEMIKGFTFGEIVPSEGYLAKLQRRAAKTLATFSEEMRTHLLTQSMIHWDDTEIMVNQHRACLRFYGDEHLALYKAHMQKNKEGVIKDQLLTLLNETTTVMHDHLTMNYGEEFSYTNVECNVHLLRDLRSCVDNTQHRWADDLAGLIGDTLKRRKQLVADGIDGFSFLEADAFFIKLNECWLLGDKENKKDDHLYYVKKERALLNRLMKYRTEYFNWVLDFNVPFSNNTSERSLRGVKSKLKIAGQFQTITSAQNYAIIRTYAETCKRHGLNIVDAFGRAVEGNPYKLKEILTNQINR
jgi:hypothetical protein